MPEEKRVNPQVEVRDVETEGEIGTLSGIATGPQGPQGPQGPLLPEVEVDQIVESPRLPQGVPMVTIRVNEDVEEMSYVAGGRVERYTFEAGVRYNVPIYIAAELEGIGRIWH